MLSLKQYIKLNVNLAPIEDSFEQVLNRKDIGFVALATDTKAQQASQKMASLIANYKHLVVVGMGGSSVGPRCLSEISGSQKISFLDNVDSLETQKIIANLADLKQTAWLFISKSGTTIEVLWNLELIQQIYLHQKINFWPNTFYISENTQNPLKKLSDTHQRPFLELPLNVGGRFSVLTPVGLVVATYLQMSTDDLLRGAQLALQSKTKIINCVAQYLSSFTRQENISLFWFYSSNMRWFGSWLQQLWAESLGKKITRSHKPAPEFSTPMICIGACDQHSILQQIIEGPKNKFVNIFRFKNVEKSIYINQKTNFTETALLQNLNYGELIKAQTLATEKALNQSEVSTLFFDFENLNTESLGYLFMFFQLVVATLGEHCNINAFDQPGVALSKKLTLALLKDQN